ncbi:HAD family hydrolase [Bacillus sp. AGMB 02131]|uniref:HAD family hydrolase n=1 Tax=Peribacillus faecalis TaxID=2772559 RepID=A0A927HCV7_9BACI|nr:HAD family hydrolase [Peribacillus faecalis]MBD3109926.1 HAD family hydrolase [Peribacillus faecalis]
MREQLLIWDLDDTIISTYAEFVKTNKQCAEAISKEIFGDFRKVDDILQRQRILDLTLIPKYGLVPPRYEMSWLNTSTEFFRQHGMEPKASVQREIGEYVHDVYVRKYKNVPGSLEVIQELKKEGFSMVVLTAGEESVQKRRIEQAGVADYMEGIHVYPYKTPNTLKEVMQQHSSNHYAMIGNSLKSDIYPALENHILGVHVQKETWAEDEHEIDRANPLYKAVEQVTEVPEVFGMNKLIV